MVRRGVWACLDPGSDLVSSRLLLLLCSGLDGSLLRPSLALKVARRLCERLVLSDSLFLVLLRVCVCVFFTAVGRHVTPLPSLSLVLSFASSRLCRPILSCLCESIESGYQYHSQRKPAGLRLPPLVNFCPVLVLFASCSRSVKAALDGVVRPCPESAHYEKSLLCCNDAQWQWQAADLHVCLPEKWPTACLVRFLLRGSPSCPPSSLGLAQSPSCAASLV